jgi:hypothetical protein
MLLWIQLRPEIDIPSILSRLTNLKPYSIKHTDSLRLNIAVDRRWLGSVAALGGGCEAYVAHWRGGRHDGDHLYHPRLDWNPQLPERPGLPGLLLRGPGDQHDFGPFSTIIRVETNTWLYIGDYLYIKQDPLTIDEWKRIPEEVCTHMTTGAGIFITKS